jgi:hypothetical protein
MRALPQNAFNYMQKSGGRPLFEVTNNDDNLRLYSSTLADEVQGHLLYRVNFIPSLRI